MSTGSNAEAAELRLAAGSVMERNQYVRDFESMAARAVELAERVTTLEASLAAAEARLAAAEIDMAITAGTSEQACERIERLSDRIAEMANHWFGPVPVQSAEANLAELERGISNLVGDAHEGTGA